MSSVAHLSRVLRRKVYTLYELLDIPPGYFHDDRARQEWKQLMKLVHPDINHKQSDGVLAATVNAAYTTLSNRATRALYEGSLRTSHVKCTACAGLGYTQTQRGFKTVQDRNCPPCDGYGWIAKGKA